MAAEYDTFGLAPATRTGGVLAGGAYQLHRDFLDFIIDGRPLLLRLADVDAVSPLASDLGPSIFTSEVRRLLLETDEPPADGRFVIYGCPECEGLECGAVTAVIERDGADIVWRDFAWQTDTTPDLERNGYAGVGPFRFRGEEYRGELERLLAEGGHEPPTRRVLLVGQRVALLARLAAALRGTGIGAEITRDAAGAHADELRTYGAVVFGQAVGEGERAAVRAAFEAAGSDAVFVADLAPIVGLLVAQIEESLEHGPRERHRLTRLTAHRDGRAGEAEVEVAAACRVSLLGYRVDRLFRPRVYELFDGQLEPGRHRLALGPAARPGSFVVARTSGNVLVAAVAPAPPALPSPQEDAG
ncbi:oxidoreductase [Streptomyces sp. NPDC050610]|uniref:oxidoreductase n=1 Tax=Streptomyces sp. NPDC050610 TaxID=3157097 RepID=UPI0034324216